jgi:N-acetylneuraminate synthase
MYRISAAGHEEAGHLNQVGYLQIGDRLVGDGQPCFIIAEAGVNHNGSLEMALRLVDVAVEAGVDAVKFQKRKLSDLYPSALIADPNSAEWAFQYLLPILKQTDLTDDGYRQVKDYCDRRGIRFLCSAWDEDSLSFLRLLALDAYKVASADLVNLPLLERLADTGKPLILSTGMSTIKEIALTVRFLNDRMVQFALLHCVSTYPAPFDSLNLRFIDTLRQFGVPVGYSGHERGIAASVAAVVLGAKIIEKHVTIDRTLPGPDHAASLEPAGLQKLVRDIRNVELALGSGEKHLSSMEALNRQVLRKSLVAAHFLPAGTVVTSEMVRVKGPGKGLSPQRIGEIIGVKLVRDLKADEYFSEGDLSGGVRVPVKSVGLRRPWGIKVRFHDIRELLRLEPRLVEFHFSDADLDSDFARPPAPFEQLLFVHAPEFSDKRLIDLCSLDDTEHSRAVKLVQRTIDKAVELGESFSGPIRVVIHVGGYSMDEPVGDCRRLLDRAAESFARLDAKGTILLPENLPPRPWYLGGQWFQNVFTSPEEMVEFCRTTGLGMTLDISHAQLYCNLHGRDLCDYATLCLPHTRHVHVADASGLDGEGLQVGEGVVEWERLLRLMGDYEFSWLPEIWSGHLNEAAGFIEAINRLSKYGIL